MNMLVLARAVDVMANYGDAVHVREVITEWVKSGHHVRLICLGTNGARGSVSAEEGRIHQIAEIHSVRTGGLFRYYPFRQVLATAVAARVARSKGPDVVYGRPSVGLSGSFDIFPEVLVAWLRRVPLVVEINGWAEDDASILGASRFFRFRRFSNAIGQRLFSRANGFIAVNASLGARLTAHFGVQSGRIRVVPNGTNPNLFRPMDRAEARRAVGLPLDEPILVFVGHVGLEADLVPVIAAVPLLLADYPNIRLVIVGKGADRRKYETIAKELGVDSRVSFVGMVPHEEVPLYVNSSDIGLVAIKAHLHSTPIKLFEYWCCAKPVVATNLPDHQFVEDVGGGLLAKDQSPRAWADAIRQLLRDASLAGDMGIRGRDYVLKWHTWEGNARAIIEFIKSRTP